MSTVSEYLAHGMVNLTEVRTRSARPVHTAIGVCSTPTGYVGCYHEELSDVVGGFVPLGESGIDFVEPCNSQIEEDLRLKQCHITKIHGSITLLSRPLSMTSTS